MTCAVLLSLLGYEPFNVSWLDELVGDCACENCSLSSFGPVHADETLLRIVVSPWHVHRKKGTVYAAVLSGAEKTGLSTLRASHATEAELTRTAEELTNSVREKDPSGGVFGVLALNAGVIKREGLQELSGSTFCVYDTALKLKPAHADICQRTSGTPPNTQQARRQELFKKVERTFVPVSRFMGGLLMPWAAASAA